MLYVCGLVLLIHVDWYEYITNLHIKCYMCVDLFYWYTWTLFNLLCFHPLYFTYLMLATWLAKTCRMWYIPIYIQQDAASHSLLFLETALHVSGGTPTHYEERIQLYLQHLVFVRLSLLPATIAAGSSNGVTTNRCCRYSRMCSWWWVVVPPETCRAVSRNNKLCNVASCWIYIGIFLQCTDPWTLNVEGKCI